MIFLWFPMIFRSPRDHLCIFIGGPVACCRHVVGWTNLNWMPDPKQCNSARGALRLPFMCCMLFRSRIFVWELSLECFRLGSLALECSLWIFRSRGIAWGVFRLIASARDFSLELCWAVLLRTFVRVVFHWEFSVETSIWEPSLSLGALGL